MQYEKKHAWSWLLRLYHWTMAFSVLVLALTGLYIHNPLTSSLTGGGDFPVADMRYVHFIAGFALACAIIIRLYLALFGNKQEGLPYLFSHLPKTLKEAWQACKGYLYIKRYQHSGLGHNGLATITYCTTFVIIILQIISGLYMLYPESTFWQSFGLTIFGTQQQARYAHYITMWYIITFVLVHVYISIWNEIKHPEGLLSSMLGGHKFKPRKS